jgi:hypothetical protein
MGLCWLSIVQVTFPAIQIFNLKHAEISKENPLPQGPDVIYGKPQNKRKFTPNI